MPSLRQPVGPLPASIYWRRRIVVLSALIAVIALVVWLASGVGAGSGKTQRTGAQQPVPAQSITPGATPTGPAITGRPGGAGGSTGGSTGGGASGAAGVSGGTGGDVSLTGGTGTTPVTPSGAAANGGGAGGASGASGGSGAAGGTGGQNAAPPANTGEVMALSICTAAQISLELASAQNNYLPKDKPRLSLTVRNTSATNCRVDLGRTASAITVTSSTGERIWSSGDCPTDRQPVWVQLVAGSGLSETFTWDRSRSKPQCATADATISPPGTYLVQADLVGPSGGPVSARTSIRLDS